LVGSVPPEDETFVKVNVSGCFTRSVVVDPRLEDTPVTLCVDVGQAATKFADTQLSGDCCEGDTVAEALLSLDRSAPSCGILKDTVSLVDRQVAEAAVDVIHVTEVTELTARSESSSCISSGLGSAVCANH
jgi:hypothetical protein